MTSMPYHMTSPDPEAKQPARCFRNVVKDAGLEMTDVDYINCHGTSTQLNEKTETTAIKRAFGEHAYKLAISSNKSIIGHLLGACWWYRMYCNCINSSKRYYSTYNQL